MSDTINLNVRSDTVIGSAYAQVVGVSITDTELTLEFVYVNPRLKIEGQVVSRITLPLVAAEGLAKTINDTVKEHKKKKEVK